MRQTRQKDSTPYFVIITAGALFLLFLSYYVFTAWHLPRGAGPDSSAHYDVAKFIYENGRLAVMYRKMSTISRSLLTGPPGHSDHPCRIWCRLVWPVQ